MIEEKIRIYEGLNITADNSRKIVKEKLEKWIDEKVFPKPTIYFIFAI